MLSILIPSYQQELVPLVRDLLRSVAVAGIEAEIIVAEDGSSPDWVKANSVMETWPGVSHLVCQPNRGRSAIRNFLAGQARFPNLLFLDADSALTDDRFISRYLEYLPGLEVVSGGRIYPAEKPAEKNLRLHWYYGVHRESKPAAQRSFQPVLSFHSNNFLVSAEIMRRTGFDENIRNYGYEDTAWAMAISRSGVNIRHVDNPVLHLGLEPSDIFLDKTDRALSNLARLESEGLLTDLPIQRMTRLLVRFAPAFIIKSAGWLKPILRRRLMSGKPSLLLFQAYRLAGYYLGKSAR